MKVCRMLVVSLMLLAVCAMAEERRMYINLDTVFNGYYKTLAANLSFEDRKQEVEDQLALIRKELDSIRDEARKMDGEMKNELLSQDAREGAARKMQACIERLRIKSREYEQARSDNYQMLQKIRMEREEELVKELLKMVDTVAEELNATEVIEVSGKTLNRVGVFLRYPKDREITDKVLSRLNKGHEQELKTAKEALEQRRVKAQEKEPVVPAK